VELYVHFPIRLYCVVLS